MAKRLCDVADRASRAKGSPPYAVIDMFWKKLAKWPQRHGCRILKILNHERWRFSADDSGRVFLLKRRHN